MKKKSLLLIAAICFNVTILMAQGNMQRLTPDERTKTVMEKMSSLNMDSTTKSKTEVIMLEFFTSQQKAMEEMRSSGSIDRDAIMAKRKIFVETRNEKLKLIFTQDQFNKWINEIEPGLRPQRPSQQN